MLQFARIGLLGALLCASLTVGAQGEAIQDIREKFQQINQISDYQIILLENEEFLDPMPDGGGELKGYFRGDTLNKVYQRIGLSYGVQTTEYYFWDGQLIFVFKFEDAFGFDAELGVIDYDQVERTFEGRYYFAQWQLIKVLEKGQGRMGNLAKKGEPDLAQSIIDEAYNRQQLLREAYREK